MLSKSLRRVLRKIVPKVDDLYAAIYAGEVPQRNKTNSAQDIKGCSKRRNGEQEFRNGGTNPERRTLQSGTAKHL